MFGYVRPRRDLLTQPLLDRYQAVYCGLCHGLGRRYGARARLTLNYDFTFLALLLTRTQPPDELTRRRCPAHPMEKRPVCPPCAGLDLAVDESLILTVHKLRDTVKDSGFFAGLPSGMAACSLRRAYRRAAERVPEFDRTVVTCLTELGRLERENAPSLDRAADTFARLLQGAASHSGDSGADRAAGQLLYHVGRWIYILDAYDDLEDDRRTGQYNPILARFGGKADIDYLRTTLRHSRAIACSAFQLLPSWSDGAIVENILYDGLPSVEELVFTGKWRKK